MINTLNVDDILITNRQRKEFKDKDIQDLANSIASVGLIHAPVIQEQDHRLLAGERRLRAIATLNIPYKYGNEEYLYPEIPVHFISTEDESLMFNIELEENLRRINLTPMEEAAALAQLHNIRIEKNPQHTIKETAKEAASLQGKQSNENDEARVSASILIEQFKDNPEVQAAGKHSIFKAAKVAKKIMELDLVKALQGIDQEEESSMLKVIPGNALEITKEFDKEIFDILLFDPPYGSDANTFGEQAMQLGHQYDDSEENSNLFIEGILTNAEIFLKPNAHVLMFCAFEFFNKWKILYEKYEYKVWARPLIWSKGQQSHAPQPDRGPRYSYECILFATRGDRKINTLINDVISVPSVKDKLHAAEKPAELIGRLIEFVARPGDSILDPCVGSGSIFHAAADKEVYVTGIEIDERYYAIAKEKTRG